MNTLLTFVGWKTFHYPNEKSIHTFNFKHVLNTHCLLNQGKILTWNLVHCTCCCLTEPAHWPKGNQDSKAFVKSFNYGTTKEGMTRITHASWTQLFCKSPWIWMSKARSASSWLTVQPNSINHRSGPHQHLVCCTALRICFFIETGRTGLLIAKYKHMGLLGCIIHSNFRQTLFPFKLHFYHRFQANRIF